MRRSERALKAALAVAAILLTAACSGTGEPAEASDAGAGSAAGAAALPEGHPPLDEALRTTAGPGAITGTVQESRDVAGYTYVRLDVEGREVWAAGPRTALSDGETVAITDPMEMRGFHSESLGETFDVIYFTGTFLRAGQGGTSGPAGAPPAGAGTAEGTVLQAIPAAGYTYVEVEAGEGRLWLAGPATELAEGNRIRWTGGSLMQGFASKTLDRTFERILFVDRLEVVDGGD